MSPELARLHDGQVTENACTLMTGGAGLGGCFDNTQLSPLPRQGPHLQLAPAERWILLSAGMTIEFGSYSSAHLRELGLPVAVEDRHQPGERTEPPPRPACCPCDQPVSAMAESRGNTSRSKMARSVIGSDQMQAWTPRKCFFCSVVQPSRQVELVGLHRRRDQPAQPAPGSDQAMPLAMSR